MTDRCFVRVQWDPATSGGGVRRAVGGFLRYLEGRNLSSGREADQPTPDPMRLLRPGATLGRAAARAELFGPEGIAGAGVRRAFVSFVTRSIEETKPELYRTREGRLLDLRRSVYRFIVSPESAEGLDLQRLLRRGIVDLENDIGVGGLRWLAAIHRNTQQHHLHLVLAGMYRDDKSVYHRIDIQKRHLEVLKRSLVLEIKHQRSERMRSGHPPIRPSDAVEAWGTAEQLIESPIAEHPPGSDSASTESRLGTRNFRPRRGPLYLRHILRLRAVARRYWRQVERNAEAEARDRGWERAA